MHCKEVTGLVMGSSNFFFIWSKQKAYMLYGFVVTLTPSLHQRPRRRPMAQLAFYVYTFKSSLKLWRKPWLKIAVQ
jgi:hypothetical protein